MSQLATFLRKLKAETGDKLIPNLELGKLKIVLGNGACDLDSAACTLAIALFKTLKERNEHDVIWPVFNMSKEEMVLKTEVLFFFDKMNLSPDDLIYREEIEDELFVAQQRGRLELTLVDHHYDETHNICVREIFDHHVIQEEINPFISTTVKPVGSCATLVMQYMASEPALIRTIFSDYREIVDMCYGAILLDTVNFNARSKRFTDSDESMARFIEINSCADLDEDAPRKKVYRELLAARNDVSKLSPLQLLQKDCKTVSGLPICGLTMLVQDYVRSYPGAEQALQHFAAKADSTEVVLVGMSIVEGYVKRDLGFYLAPNSPLLEESDTPRQRLDERLCKLTKPDFELRLLKFPINGFDSIRIYKQRNVQLTRKHLIPAINEVRELILPQFCDQ